MRRSKHEGLKVYRLQPLVADILGQFSALAMVDAECREHLAAFPQAVIGEFGLPAPDVIRLELVADPALGSAANAMDPTLRLYVREAIDLTAQDLAMVAGAVSRCQGSLSTECAICTIPSAPTALTRNCNQHRPVGAPGWLNGLPHRPLPHHQERLTMHKASRSWCMVECVAAIAAFARVKDVIALGEEVDANGYPPGCLP